MLNKDFISGAIRRMDDLGRIALPKNMRTDLEIVPGEVFEVYAEDGKIILYPLVLKEREV